jgi:hypothetical protein
VHEAGLHERAGDLVARGREVDDLRRRGVAGEAQLVASATAPALMTS